MKFLILLGYILGLGVSSEFNLPRNNCSCVPGAPICASDWKTYYGECFMRCQNPRASVLFQGPCAFPSRQFNNYQQPNPYLPTTFTNPSTFPPYLSPTIPSSFSPTSILRDQFPSSIPYTTPSLPPHYPTPSSSPLPFPVLRTADDDDFDPATAQRRSPSSIPYTTPSLPPHYPTSSPSPLPFPVLRTADDDDFDPATAQRRSMSSFFSTIGKSDKVYDVIKKGLQLEEEVKDVMSDAATEENKEHTKVTSYEKDGEDDSVNDNVRDDEHVKTGEDVTDADDLKDDKILKTLDNKNAEDINVANDAIDITSKEADYKNEAQTAIDTKEVEVPSITAAPIEV